METVVAHVQPSNKSSNIRNSKASTESTPATAVIESSSVSTVVTGGGACLVTTTQTDSTTTAAKLHSNSPSSTRTISPLSVTTVNNNSNSSSSNPIFVITSSSSSSPVGGKGEGVVPSSNSSNNLEMPSNSHPATSSSTSPPCHGGESVVSSSVCAGSAHSEEDDGGGGAMVAEGSSSGGSSVNGSGGAGNTNKVAPVPSSVGEVSSTSPSIPSSGSQQQQRHSNPRQSTLTRSHAITLDEDSDSGSTPQEPQVGVGGKHPLPQEQEQELIHFIMETCNRNVKDKHFILRIEADLTQFVKDESRLTLPFPQMTSYQRMLVHRMATLFDLDHNVDNSSGGNFVVVSKDLNERGGSGGHEGRIPPIRFKELLTNNPAMIVPTSAPSHLITVDPSISATSEVVLIDPNTGNTLTTAPLNTASTTSSSVSAAAAAAAAASKKILKREKPNLTGSDKMKGGGGPAKTKSLEERTQDYHKARRRIFEDNSHSMESSVSGISPDNSQSTSCKKLNWSSTDSSEDRMYLKPPYPGSAGGKLIKVESFESASQKKPSNRDSRAMGKSHSFGGYEESNQQPQGVSSHGGGGPGGKNFPRGANNNSNNASSSMISCSSSSSLRSSSFSKQDSSSSTTSGSGQSPSGGTSSGSTSGYKSGSSSGGGGGSSVGGVIAGYYTSGGGGIGIGNVHGANSGTPLGAMALQAESMKGAAAGPAIIFAPAGGTHPHQTIIQGEDIMTSGAISGPNTSQQVMFCCVAVADVNNVPPGAMIIDPNTGQAMKNNDGTQYFYDPTNPPKFVQTMPVPHQLPPQPPPPSTPQQQHENAYSPALYPPPQAVFTGPPMTAAYAPLQPPPQTPTGTGVSGATPLTPQPTAYMTIPAPGPGQMYFAASQPTAVSSALNSVTTGAPQDIQELSGYFSQLAVASGPGGRQVNVNHAPQPSVIYVPVDAFNNTATFTAPIQADQQSQGSSTGGVGPYYDDGSNLQQSPPSAIPIQAFQAPSVGGYVLQQVVDPTAGSAAPGVYYYGGNLVQAQTVPAAAQSSNGSVGATSIVQQSHPHAATSAVPPTHSGPQQQQQHQQRFKNSWVMPHHHQHHPNQQPFSIHGAATGQIPSGAVTPQQQSNPSGPPPPGAIMIHPSAMQPNSGGSTGLVSVLPPHPSTLSGAPTAVAAQQLGPQSQQNSTLVPLSYHHPSQPPSQPGTAASAQALMQTLVPCVQSPVYPVPQPPQHQHQPQSFSSMPPSHNHPQQQHHHPHSFHSSSRSHHNHQQHHHPSHSHQSHQHNNPSLHGSGNGGVGSGQQHPLSHQTQPRFVSVAGASNAAAAAAAAASQQQFQQSLFAAAAAAMAMSSNYSNFTTGTNTGGRYMKGGGRGGGSGSSSGGLHQHGAVTGVVRRSRNHSTSKQQQNSSK